MTHAYYADVSAKIEDWEKDSVIAVANDRCRTLKITAEVKQALITLLGTNHPVQFSMLAIFTYIAIRPFLAEATSITIDMDYSGDRAHRIIKAELLDLIRREQPTFKAKRIRFDNIAGTTADELARSSYRKKQSDGVISLVDVQRVLGQ